ncbi:MAG: hypothetical protein J6J44_04555 [Lachnospiraceae bacterium]|nr:hypothetical protein [Lachnospiraceae bacterium]
MLGVDGGGLAEGFLTAVGGITTTIAAIELVGGTGAAALSVGFLAAVGPVGWACIGIGVAGAVATGVVTADALKK